MSSSVLEKDYVDADRPYSKKELQFIRASNRRALRLGKVRAEHSKCGHFYLTKYNGRKEKEILESKCNDTGNCSVCWKLSKTPRHLRRAANNLVDYYVQQFGNEPEYFTYEIVEGETDFYTWLYAEQV